MAATSYAAARRILRGEGKKPAEVRKAYYVCGPETYLIEDFVALVGAEVKAQDRVTVDATKVKPSEVWAQVAQYPSGESRRLVTVRGAETITDWAWFETWYADKETPKVCVVFVTSEDPDTEAPHIVRLAKQGGLVRCRPLSKRDAVYLISSVCGASPVQAEFLWERCGGDGGAILDAARKLRYLDRAEPEVVSRVIPPGADGGFVDHLVADRKPEALRSLRDGVELSAAVGRLNDRLERLVRLARVMRKGDVTIFALAKATGFPAAQVALLKPHAFAYDRERLDRCSSLLWVADTQIQRGRVEGVGEMLVSMW